MFKLVGLNQKISTLGKHFFIDPRHLISSSAFSTLSSTKRVGTHNGTFHCDEALACSMLRLTKDFSGAHIVRTRDPQVLDSLDAVVDVGGVYDPSRHRYDHHQHGFTEVLGHGFTTKLSSAGLVYKGKGGQGVGIETHSELNLESSASQGKLRDTRLQGCWLYQSHFGLEIIAKELKLDEGHPHISMLKGARPDGNLVVNDSDQSCERENEAFHQAMDLAGCEFLENVHYYKQTWLPARSIVMDSLAERETIDSSGEIIKLSQSCPWKLHIHELEEEMNISPSIKYVLYPDDRSENWRLQAVAISPYRFDSRKPLPKQWRGLENDKLSEVAGIPGCIFVHMSGFIGGNGSYDGALAMARASLKD
ncbi:UPF0160 protein MYG1, mitochondrial-like isoform X1 [Senna tora]|uniref:UPF0160 protein MYG1, mitochondrial-like isoform X1 n=1 Tax=Senna tora TaxID=362788 RepID=A0A834TZ68_9FABA|nr:UPF0160 protein MYG1, mitochondrial-like isoform X1 [Senna tora]